MLSCRTFSHRGASAAAFRLTLLAGSIAPLSAHLYIAMGLPVKVHRNALVMVSQSYARIAEGGRTVKRPAGFAQHKALEKFTETGTCFVAKREYYSIAAFAPRPNGAVQSTGAIAR